MAGKADVLVALEGLVVLQVALGGRGDPLETALGRGYPQVACSVRVPV